MNITVVTFHLKSIVTSQEGSPRRIHVSLEDTAVTPTLCVDPERELSSTASVPLASTVMGAHVMVRMMNDIMQKKRVLAS